MFFLVVKYIMGLETFRFVILLISSLVHALVTDMIYVPDQPNYQAASHQCGPYMLGPCEDLSACCG